MSTAYLKRKCWLCLERKLRITGHVNVNVGEKKKKKKSTVSVVNL